MYSEQFMYIICRYVHVIAVPWLVKCMEFQWHSPRKYMQNSPKEFGQVSRVAMNIIRKAIILEPLHLCVAKRGTRFHCCAMSQEKSRRGSPTLFTPTRPLKRIPLRVRGSPRGRPLTSTRPLKRVQLRALYPADNAESEGVSSGRQLSKIDEEWLPDGVAALTHYSRTSVDTWS